MSKPAKIFKLTATINKQGGVSVVVESEGINPFEIIGILQTKILEIQAQLINPEKFEFKTTRILTTKQLNDQLKAMKQ